MYSNYEVGNNLCLEHYHRHQSRTFEDLLSNSDPLRSVYRLCAWTSRNLYISPNTLFGASKPGSGTMDSFHGLNTQTSYLNLNIPLIHPWLRQCIQSNMAPDHSFLLRWVEGTFFNQRPRYTIPNHCMPVSLCSVLMICSWSLFRLLQCWCQSVLYFFYRWLFRKVQELTFQCPTPTRQNQCAIIGIHGTFCSVGSRKWKELWTRAGEFQRRILRPQMSADTSQAHPYMSSIVFSFSVTGRNVFFSIAQTCRWSKIRLGVLNGFYDKVIPLFLKQIHQVLSFFLQGFFVLSKKNAMILNPTTSILDVSNLKSNSIRQFIV